MDFNVELSKLVTSAIDRFDSLPGARESNFWSEAAGRDIAKGFGNFRLFRVVGTVIGFIFLVQLSSISKLLSKLSGSVGLEIHPSTFMMWIVSLLFFGGWAYFFVAYPRAQAKKLASLDPNLALVIRNLHDLEESLRPQFGMFSQNLADLRKRMIKTFSNNDADLSGKLIELTEKIFGSDAFNLLAEAEPAYREKRVAFTQALLAARVPLTP